MHALLLLSVVFLLVSVFTLRASGLKCNKCSSSISLEDCINQQHDTDCDRDYKCGKFYYKLKEKDVYSLSCISSLHCNDPGDICRVSGSQMTDCDLTCCDKDLCNIASPPVASVLVVLACVLGTLMVIGYQYFNT